MKVLVWTSTFPPPTDDGTAVFVQRLCEELFRNGHRVRVLTSWRGKEIAKHDFKRPYQVVRYRILNRPSRLSFIPNNVWVTFQVFRFRPDLIFLGHAMSSSALSLIWLSKRLSTPYLILVHGTDLDYSANTRMDRWALKLVLCYATLLLTNSRFTKEKLMQYQSRIRDTAVLYPGVDINFFKPGDGGPARRRYNMGEKKICLSVARVAARKGHDKVLRAMPEVLKHVPDTVYLIAGRGPEKERLKNLSRELGIMDHVRFLGFVEDAWLPSLYNACDLFVMPAYTVQNDVEGFGIVYSEAAACGLPIIGGRGGGVPEAVLDGETGVLVNPLDVDELAVAMVRLLKDKEMALRLGESGRRRVERELSWEKVGKTLESYLKRTVTIEE